MSDSIQVITLGCSKNTVDSEHLLAFFYKAGFPIIKNDDQHADIIIINTCGFINDAKQESIDVILEYAALKQQNKIKKLLVMGCLAERYKSQLTEEMPEVDKFFGVNEMPEILDYLKAKTQIQPESRFLTTPNHYAFLKIAEGCDRTCAFCAIPAIRGAYQSRTIESLFIEASELEAKGVKELILIAQDLSYYGLDIAKKQLLPDLVQKLSEIDGIQWIRLHYLYPANFPFELIDLMKTNPKLCHYLDIPFQHYSDKMLKLMKRNHSKKDIQQIIEKIRNVIPDITLRTSILVGYPGETETDFEELKQFVKETKLDRLGVFTYSHEEETYAWHNFEDNVPDEIKQARMDELMQIQQQISLNKNQTLIGKTIKCIVDRKEESSFVGRTYMDSPEIDNEVLIFSENLEIGAFYNVIITEASDYDLIGKLL
jgi:ribosomal protein S12 methylthiotransferase